MNVPAKVLAGSIATERGRALLARPPAVAAPVQPDTQAGAAALPPAVLPVPLSKPPQRPSMQRRPAKPKKPRATVRQEEYRPQRLQLRGVDGYLTHSRGEITAWFVEPPVAWSMRSLDVREKRLTARALRIAELVERGVTGLHQRVVHRPWPVQQWGRDFDAWAHAGATVPPPDVPDALSWSDFVMGEQYAQLRRPATSKSVYWGVPLSKRSALAQLLEWGAGASSWAGPVHRLLARHMDAVLDRELAELAEELRDLSQVMAAFGVHALPATAQQMQWLLWRSATLGLPAPRMQAAPSANWDVPDLAALVDAAQVVAEPLRDCVQVTGVIDGQSFTRYVAIVTAGRMGELAIPERNLPWQVWGDALGPIDQSVRLRFTSPEAVRRSLDRQINRILNQERHITVEHGLQCPPDLEEKVERATLIKHEVETDHTKLATRVEGWWRFAVSAMSVEEVLQAADALRNTYSPQIAMESAEGQYQQYREFMPHEPLSSTAHRRRMSVRLVAAGLASVTDRLGDRHGPNIAETASLSRRPVNWDMWFAQEVLDKSGLTPVVGGLGSGKMLELATKVPTPHGWTTMGDLSVGDQVLGRDGKPCTVTALSDINDEPDLYEITFSDGQKVLADYEHQWLVSIHQDRNYVREPKRIAAIRRWEASRATISRLGDLAARFDDHHESSVAELFALLSSELDVACPWKKATGLGAALDFLDCPSRLSPRDVTKGQKPGPSIAKQQVLVYPAAAFLRANIVHWETLIGSNAARWGAAAERRTRASREVLQHLDDSVEATIAEISDWLVGAGAPRPSPTQLREAACRSGVLGRPTIGEVIYRRRKTSFTVRRPVTLYPTTIALKALAARVEQQFGTRPSAEAAERRLTTGEILAEGLVGLAGAQFAIRVPKPVDLLPADLRVNPYVLGAWLGDGSTGQGTITQGESEACTDNRGLTDRDFLVEQLRLIGIEARACGLKTIGTRGLAKQLTSIGVLRHKHIPTEYLRASAAQRLALLQGLMDTDGTIDPKGCCELCLCDEGLARSALELIRSLGIKASMTSSPAVITEADPDQPGAKRRRVTGIRWRIHFTTSTPVFRLPRKAERLPTRVREVSKWLYITSIEPVPPSPARCITVDSSDHTYLIEDFIPTSNTHLCGMCVYKAVRVGAHGIVLDPSGPLRKLAELPELAPFTRLIDLMQAPPGTLNPYRVIVDPAREDYPGPDGPSAYESDVRAVAAERKTFVADVLRMLLPWDMQQSPLVRRAMDKAVDEVGGSQDREPGMVVEALDRIAANIEGSTDIREAAEDAARKLNELRFHRQVRLLFPQPGIDGWAELVDARLTILTMPGVQLPKLDTDPGTWSLPQRLGVPLVHLAAWLTHRLIYEAPREVRKIVFLDEGKYLSGSGAGQTLYARLERDTRKYNVRALIASQLPDDFLALPGFEALTHEVIIGALTGERAHAAALQLLRLDADSGWQQLLANLNSQGGLVESTHDPDALAAQDKHARAPREYLMRIGDDVEIVRVDYAASPHLAHVLTALDSNPTADTTGRAARST